MKMDQYRQSLLRRIPGVDKILETAYRDPFFEGVPKSVLLQSIRLVFEGLRKNILEGDPPPPDEEFNDPWVLDQLKIAVFRAMTPNLRRVVNATGIVVHTNLGRSLLSREAISNLTTLAGHYSNLEFDLEKGRRGSRYSAVEDLLCEITGAEAAMAVNNNAGAVFLCLETLAAGKSVIISRGQLVEIGGSFRIPDVMAKSGAVLKEVGTTNRTHFKDYEKAIEQNTGLLLKVHTSNFSIVGFTAGVSLEDLVILGKRYRIPVMEDLGSGTLMDFSRFGLTQEPTVQDSIQAGADVVTFSGDKLLGGPQAGIILGKKEYMDRIKENPITRALRIDKLTLGALETTLRQYRDPDKAITQIPTLRMLTRSLVEIESQAQALAQDLNQMPGGRVRAEVISLTSKAGGGSMPLLELPTKGVRVTVSGKSENDIEKYMRSADPPVIGRIENDRFVMDMRTVQEDDPPWIEKAFAALLQN
jgi:L-seryl-tRNA(Ser) seleniumtransferase